MVNPLGAPQKKGRNPKTSWVVDNASFTPSGAGFLPSTVNSTTCFFKVTPLSRGRPTCESPECCRFDLVPQRHWGHGVNSLRT